VHCNFLDDDDDDDDDDDNAVLRRYSSPLQCPTPLIRQEVDIIHNIVITSDKGGRKCVCPRLFCLSVCLC